MFLFCVPSDLVSSSLQAEVKLQYNSLAELLRHFWSCFPVKTQFLEEKVGTMHENLFGKQVEKLRECDPIFLVFLIATHM